MMLGEGGETKLDTNVNFLLEDFGVVVNNGASLGTSTADEQTRSSAHRTISTTILKSVL